jgi:flagellar basal-body rod protein FlgB
MATSLDTYLGIHPQALKISSLRSELIATNLANADTPNYKAKDIDFKAALAASGNSTGKLAMTGSTQGVTQTGHIALSSMSSATQADEQYRVPLASSLDGNTVDTQMEQANYAQNVVRYQATLTMLNAKFRSLMTAITGQ